MDSKMINRITHSKLPTDSPVICGSAKTEPTPKSFVRHGNAVDHAKTVQLQDVNKQSATYVRSNETLSFKRKNDSPSDTLDKAIDISRDLPYPPAGFAGMPQLPTTTAAATAMQTPTVPGFVPGLVSGHQPYSVPPNSPNSDMPVAPMDVLPLPGF